MSPKPPKNPKSQRALGAYRTRRNPFNHPAFRTWAARCALASAQTRIVEPFAGAGDIGAMLRAAGYPVRPAEFDIAPQAEGITQRDTLRDFPEGYQVAITNPPWLARNNAKRWGIPYPADIPANDIYKHAITVCLAHCDWLAAIVPASFIQRPTCGDRLVDFVSLAGGHNFGDTDAPAGIALFQPTKPPEVGVWGGDSGEYIATLRELEATLPQPDPKVCRVQFHIPHGEIGLIAIDNTWRDSIRFVAPNDDFAYAISARNRSITRLRVTNPEGNPISVSAVALNSHLTEWRAATKDALMPPFYGLRADGQYRRRLTWRTARGIITHHLAHDRRPSLPFADFAG